MSSLEERGLKLAARPSPEGSRRPTELAATPENGRRIVAEGHDLGNHTWSHQAMRFLTEADAVAEVARGAQAVVGSVGTQGLLFRPSGTPSSTPKIRAAARAAGYHRCVSYDVDPQDFADPGRDAVVQRMLAGVAAGSIITLHLGHLGTVQALPAILAGLPLGDFAPFGSPIWSPTGEAVVTRQGAAAAAETGGMRRYTTIAVCVVLWLVLAGAGIAACTSTVSSTSPSTPAGSTTGALAGSGSRDTRSASAAATGAPVNLPYAHTGPGDLGARAAAARRLIYAPNQVAGTVQVIDPTTYTVVVRFRVARSPEHVRPSHDLSTLRVTE